MTPEFADYLPNTAASLLARLKTEARSGTSGEDFEFDLSVHHVISSIPSKTAGSSLHPSQRSGHETFSVISQSEAGTGSIPQTKTVLPGHVKSGVVGIPNTPEAHQEYQQKPVALSAGLENTESQGKKIESEFLKSIPDESQFHLDNKPFQPARNADRGEQSVVDGLESEQGLVGSEVGNDRNIRSKSTSSKSAALEVNSKAPSTTVVSTQKADNVISQEDYVHAFMNGLVPSAGIATKSNSPAVSEDGGKFKPPTPLIQQHVSGEAPTENRHAPSVSSDHSLHLKATNPPSTYDQSGVSDDAKKSVPAQVQGAGQTPVLNSHENAFSPDSAPSKSAVQSRGKRVRDNAFSLDNRRFHSFTLGQTEEPVREDRAGVSIASGPSPKPNKMEDEEKEESKKCVTNTQGVRHCTS